MPRALRVCPSPGCPNPTPGGRCDQCRAKAEQARGSARRRGYDHRHETHFRPGVLRRDPLCTCTTPGHGHGPQCLRPSSVADHHPHSRRELVAMGMDPYDPQHGRGLCKSCHDQHTAHAQPGGWNARM